MEGIRIDKWLWAARFYKTRGLAQTAIDSGKVLIEGERVKLARAVRLGESIRIRSGDLERTVIVRGLAEKRGSASIAQTLYEETPESLRKRVEEAARRALQPEPAFDIEGGRPTKRNRRQLDRWRG